MVDVEIVNVALRRRIIGFGVWGCRNEAGIVYSDKFGKHGVVQRRFGEVSYSFRGDVLLPYRAKDIGTFIFH